MCIPCDATPRPTRASPARPRRGRILSFAVTLHAIDAPLFFRFDHFAYAGANDLHGKLHGTRAPLQTPVPNRLRLGPHKGPPAQNEHPSKGPTITRSHDPAAPPNLLAVLMEAQAGGQTSRARHTDLAGSTGGRTQSPERRLLNMDDSSTHLLSYSC